MSVVPQSVESLRRVIGEAHRRYTRWINGGFHAYLLLLIGGDHSPIARAQQNR